MRTYNNDGIREYNSGVNYGVKIVSSTKIINTSYTNSENIRFTFAGGVDYAFELTWYEFNIYNNGTQWCWWGDYGAWISSGGTVSGRFGQTVRIQSGTNNGVGTISISGNSIIWTSRTSGVSQNISSVYLVAHCSRWDKVTISYPGITTTTTTTSAPTTTTTTTAPVIPPTTTTTTTSPFIPATTTTTTTAFVIPTTTTTTTVAPNYKFYFQLVDLTNPPNLGGGSMTLNATGGSATFVTDYTLTRSGINTYGPSGSTATANSGKRIQKIDKIAYDGSTVLYTTNVASGSYTFPSGVFDMTSTGTGAGQFQTIKVYIEAAPTTTTTTSTSTSTTSSTTSTTSSTTSTTTCGTRYYELSGCLGGIAYTTIVPTGVGQRFVLPFPETYYTYTGASSIQCTPPSGYNSSIQATGLSGCP